MKTGLKVLLAITLPLVLIAGGVYGLAKVGIVPVETLTGGNPALLKICKAMGLKPSKPVKVNKPAPLTPAVPDRVAQQKSAFDKERADMQAQIDALRSAQAKKAVATSAALDPKNIARLATVYEGMSPETVTKIFAKLPDDEVIAILRRMDEKKVGQILAAVTPEHAASLTQALAQPAPPAVASN